MSDPTELESADGVGGTTVPGTSRRHVLTGAVGAVGVALGGGVGWAVGQRDGGRPNGEDPVEAGTAVHGATQAGIVRPETPQPFGLLVIGTLADPTDLGFLAGLGGDVAALIDEPPPSLLPDGAMSLTVTVGLGPRAVASAAATLPGADDLPPFAGDEQIAASARGGDLLLALFSADPGVLGPAAAWLTDRIPGYTERWSQSCFRGPATGGQPTIVRNPLGFHDSVQIPRGAEDLAEDVWIDEPLPGATIMVVRRLRLDLPRFHALPVARREEVIGRRLDGSPLSGGEPFAPVDVVGKAADGTYLTPPRAHVRAAHPTFAGTRLMLRRSYAYDNGVDSAGHADQGLLFMSFQKDLRTFVVTQQRLDELDDLMGFATPTGSATFLILPGYQPERPLGAGLA